MPETATTSDRGHGSLPWRARAAVAAMRLTNAASRRTGRGAGTVVGGRVGLAVDPQLLSRLAGSRAVALVSGTNGKTTTTACLTAALRTMGEVASNSTGSNMPEGHVAALGSATHATTAVLECDEVWLPRTVAVERPVALVLLNLSRDQLDRTSEVRSIAARWREACASFEGVVVANADDPLVCFAASAAPRVAWYAGGCSGLDATSCPACGERLEVDDRGWRCRCGLRRPTPDAASTGCDVVVDGATAPFEVRLPGGFNRANATGAALAAVRLGVPLRAATEAICAVGSVAGRFAHVREGATDVRLMLAKNPAGWGALLELVADDDGPVVLAVNARTADGHDPSWLYDVEFERLAGRRVVASGERATDLGTRLHYGDVAHTTVADVRDAIAAAAQGATRLDVIANYTAFAGIASSYGVLG